MEHQKLLTALPSVDEVLKSAEGTGWLGRYPRRYVLQGIRDALHRERDRIRTGERFSSDPQTLVAEMEDRIHKLCSYSLQPAINATGVVVHTNLGRSVLSGAVLRHVTEIAAGYSNLEYDLEHGRRGKRYGHVQRLLNDITGAEASLIVNNNAAAVFVCLLALAKGREVIVSRGELVEIGGSFRIPDVMSSSGATLREVGTTNKTHAYDYENAINENTALLMKVHQSNFRMVGFTETPSIERLAALGKRHNVPVMFDLGSGSLIDMKPYGIYIEPTVQEILKAGADLVTFSGDKLLGGPQGGVIVGKKELIDIIAKNQLMRAVRVDKMTLAAFEATLHLYLDEERAKKEIPTLRMLFMKPQEIKKRAQKIVSRLKKAVSAGAADIRIVQDASQSGGGALSEIMLETFAVAVRPAGMTVNAFEAKLRKQKPPIVARIKDDAVVLDARTIPDAAVASLVAGVAAAISA
ncbi:MAG TPA: L-seryl-tRNA(Sec) selenium transferase [Dissulfurispiraceae bacterium]|nr:L-seryl-tRNA(Sec) selenium transferase [Dissulfurispiraceae bacterium]